MMENNEECTDVLNAPVPICLLQDAFLFITSLINSLCLLCLLPGAVSTVWEKWLCEAYPKACLERKVAAKRQKDPESLSLS
jgi:hypothetical protein